MGSTERRTVTARHNRKNSKFVVTHEHIIEMDLADIPAKINEVKGRIAQMEFHAKRLDAELKNARTELETLQEAYAAVS